MKNIKIVATENGPFKIDGTVTIKNSSDKYIANREETYLCRCGGSSDKPFCDGTHRTNGFSGDKNPDHPHSVTKAYVGKHITIYDNRSVCSHRGYCTQELPSVFTETEAGINPDGDTVEKIIAQCDKCPSGALSYALPNELRNKGIQEDETTIKLAERHYEFHGPYDVKGHFKIKGQVEMAPEAETKTTLCRCGHSKNKPYCSGEHYYVQFEDKKNE